MAKLVKLLSGQFIAGQMRYPVEGPITVSDDDADRLIEQELAEEIVQDDPEGEPALSDLTVDELKALAAAEGVDLKDATKKAEIISAIEAHRAPAA